MKQHYESPVLKVIGFDCEDIITTSPVTIDPNPDVGNTDTDFGD